MKYHRLSPYLIKKIIKCFSEDITATTASRLLDINRNTINSYYNLFRKLILEHNNEENKKEYDEEEWIDNQYPIRASSKKLTL